MTMRKSKETIKVRWEYLPTSDAEARLAAAFEMLLGEPSSLEVRGTQNLTENQPRGNMPHDEDWQ